MKVILEKDSFHDIGYKLVRHIWGHNFHMIANWGGVHIVPGMLLWGLPREKSYNDQSL